MKYTDEASSNLRAYIGLACALGLASPIARAQLWTEIGPAPITNVQYSGRISAIAPSRANASLYYIAGADAGVWRSTDAGVTWMPVTDFMPTLAIGAVAVDPTNDQVIYAGTGEGNHANHSRYGLGIYKSTDGGNSWSQLAQATFAGRCFTKIVVDPQNTQRLFASITRAGGFPTLTAAKGHPGATGPTGVFRSTDGGVSWTQLAGGLPSVDATDIAINPANSQVVYAAIGHIFGNASNGIYKSSNGGNTWSKLAGGLPGGMLGRISIAVAPSDPAMLYTMITNPASASGDSATTLAVMRSINSGTNWASFGANADQATYGWYLSTVSVRPTAANTVFFGGLTLTRHNGSSSSTVTPPHVDLHALEWDAAGRLLCGDDGGLHRTSNLGANWTSLNEGLGTIQFYAGVSTSPSSESTLLGGMQDNGSALRDSDGWDHVTGGDGGWTQIDQQSPLRMFTESQGTGSLYRSTNGGASFNSSGSGLSGRNAFLPPYVIDPVNPDRMLYGTERIFRSTNGGTSWSAISADLSNGQGAIRALAIAPSNPNVVWAATNDGNVQRSNDGGSTFTKVKSAHPGWPRVTREIFIDPVDSSKVYLAGAYFGIDQVQRTTDGGATWHSLDGDLPDIPVNMIAADTRTTTATLYAGTDSGVYRSIDDGSTWRRFAANMPYACVIDLRLDIARDRLIAATQGRGAWSVSLTCHADFDGSGFVDIEDYSAFVAAFIAGVDWADFDQSGFVDTVDFDAFVTAFEAGC
ncbi:MAG: hypothetical protein IT435_04160 [Phycisphaerales bacterium]|nr:hypothetical protein [Phycisphaerales bacterium]